MKKYIYTIIICALTIVASYGLINLYKSKFIEKDINPLLEKTYKQLQIKELANYVNENANFTVYITNSIASEEFVTDFKNYITEKDLLNDILIVNGETIKSSDKEYLKSIYAGSLNFNTVDFTKDIFLTFTERKITDYILIDENSTINLIDNTMMKSELLND